MFVHAVTSNSVFTREQGLLRTLPSGVIQGLISESERTIQAMLRNMRKEIKKYSTPLLLAEDAVSTTSVTGTPATADLERSIWVSTVTSVTGTLTLTLKGCDTEDGDYKSIEAYSFNTPSESSPLFISGNNLYNYYRVDASGSGVYSSAMYEDSFYYATLYLTIANAYLMLSKDRNDGFFAKYEEYRGRFEESMQLMTPSYDSDGDGAIGENEIRPAKSTELFR